jgi:PAS domain S-box-containing protein
VPSSRLPPLLQFAPVAIASVDLGGRVLDANQALLESAGLARDEVVGRPFSAFLDREHDARTGSLFAALAAGEIDSYRAERQYRSRTGERREIDLSVSLVRDADGRPECCLAVLQDVSAHKRALHEAAATQEALRLSEARYRALVEQAPFSIQILAPDGRTLQVNRAWERLWGLTLEDLRGYNMLEDDQLAERGLTDYIGRAFAGEAVLIPAASYDPHRTIPRAHPESTRWVRGVMYPLKADDGAVQEVVLMHEDITEQVIADQARRAIEKEREGLLADMRRAVNEAEAASRVKDEFLATLSHELRTPLNAVLGWARILRSRELNDQVARALSVIERNAAAQARLIDDLLDMSRIITGNIRLNLQPVQVPAVARAALDSIRPAADAKGIRVRSGIDDPLPPIASDPERLQQIFWNLLSNAVKFTEPGGEVVLSVSADAAALRATVSDTGIGIAPEVLPFVFERFRQGDSSSTRAHPGLGLGLSIVRHLVELHGGTVSAESRGPGQGATFRIVMPLGH